MDSNVHAGHVEDLEHDLGHLLSVDLGVQRGISQEDGVLVGADSELDVEGMAPDLLHVVPILDDTLLNGGGDLEHASHLLSLVAEVLILALKTLKDAEVLGPADDRREDGSRSVFAREACLDIT